MQVKNLIKWVTEAQLIHEQSWNGENYKMSKYDALAQTSPKASKDIEFTIACFLMDNAWDEAQQWNETF